MSRTSRQTGSGADKYRLLFELGQGGTANVWLAVSRGPAGFLKLFVVKRLRPAYAQDPDFRAMFMTEARLSARLNHPHVVQVYEVLEHEGTPSILMEYIEGQTLDAALALPEPRLPLELHLRILADVLSGLHYSHELRDLKHARLNVVHRDVSPHNVMVSYEGVVKLLDFGIAKLSGTNVETDTGVVKGKLRYMPPEQIAGEEVDRRADVFAIGVMLWEALSGQKLWKGMSDAAITKRVLAGDIPPPHDPGVEIPPELVAICLRALAKDREQRFQTALELELALEAHLARHSHSVSARDVGRFMVERFAKVREDIEQRVENEIGWGESSPPAGWSISRGATPKRSGYTTSGSLPGEQPRSQLWTAAVACVAVGLVILLWGLRERPELKVVSSARPVIVAATSSVRISIEARPAHAQISIDDEPVANPYVAERTRDTARHRLRVSAPDHAPQEAELTFDTDLRVFRALSPLPPVSVASSRGTPGSPLEPSPLARATAPKISSVPAAPASCDPPYFLNARGIKKFKPECI